MTRRNAYRNAPLAALGAAVVLWSGALSTAWAQGGRAANPAPAGPWADKSLPPDRRADLALAQMTLDEKIGIVHGWQGTPQAAQQSLGGAGFIPGIPRLGIPAFQMTDGRSGVANTGGRGRYATALPSSLAAGASWDLKLAYDYGALVGKETRELGFNVSLGGTANLIREPRNGRNFECWGEDPLLIGEMLGRELKGTQDQGVVGNINRYAVNDQETGRAIYSVIIDKRAMQESDLLAFQIAIKESDVATVMCAYNKLNGVFDCENPYLLNDTLKKDWGYKGWVMSDWGAVHSTVPTALAGFDQEMPAGQYYGEALKTAIQNGEVPMARLDDMVHRILRASFAVGIYDNRQGVVPVNPFTGAEVAQRVAEQSITLLKNAGGLLPLRAAAIKSIAVIGSHADAGVLSGAGSDQVNAAGGNAVPPPQGSRGGGVWHPSPPLVAIRAKAPNAKVEYNPGTDVAAAAKLAAASDIAIVFGNQHTSEGRDVPDLSLPDNQDALIAAVAGANAHTIVVLETGGPVTMPWAEKAGAVLEAWYPGIRGGEAIANILFGSVNPSGRLPVTFPKSEADLPHPVLPGPPAAAQTGAPGAAGQGRGRGPQAPFDVNYTEGLKAGYKWFDAENKEPLFAFGFGLSYTTFSYSQLKATASGQSVTVSFQVRNTGKVSGAEVTQVYVALPASAGEPPRRLAGWDKVLLAPGESKTVSVTLDPLRLSIFDVDKDAWEVVPGEYKILVGSSSRNTPLSENVSIGGGR